MNWLIYFIITAIFAVPVKADQTPKGCDREKVAQFVEFVKTMHRQEQLIEPTFTIHDPSEDLQDVQDRLEQTLNRGIPKSELYYKVIERKTALTCTTGKHSTAVVILQLKETECEKATALKDEAQRQSCEPKEDGRTIECAWSGDALTSPFTYGFWCAQTTEEPFSYPEPEELCSAWRYGDTAAYRLPVPEAYRRWSVDMDAYAPPDCTWHQHFGTDCVKLSIEDVKGSNQLPPEKLRHTDGRTGMRGRGTNGKLGGNAYYQILVLRKTEQGDKQVLMHRLPLKMGYFTLPMFPGANMPFAHALGKTVMRQMTSKVTKCGTAAMEDLLKAATKLYGDEMWAPRNTDNSWMIMNSLVVSEESYLENIKHGPDSDFTWLSINETTEEYLKDILKRTYLIETAEKLMEPTGSIKEKLLLVKKLDVVRKTVNLSNCAALYYPFVPMGLEATEECDREKAAQFVEFAKGMHQQDQLIEPTFTIHDPEEDLQEAQDRLEQILNRGIEKPDVYYKVVERKTALTCITGKHSTAVVILQLKETECEKATALADETERQSCEPKEDGRTIECAWSGEALTSPFTYGFWCAQTTEAYRLPVPEAYRPWSVEMDAYAPPNCVWHQHFGTDCAKLSMEEVEGSNELPPENLRHKDGRTGMRGRGTNGKFGGNAFHQVLILRKTEQGDKQVLMHRLPLKMGYFTLPMFRGANMPFAHALGKKVMREMTSKVTECGTAAMEDLFKATTRLYGGVMWSPANTDNSWMTMNSLVISEESYLENIKHGSDSDFTWLSINETAEEYLKEVLTKMYPAETAEKLMEPTGSIKEKLLLVEKLDIVRQTIDLANCAALFHPFVPMGLEVGHLLGIIALAVFYF
ncbi:hypothetical protein M513_13404 [Trichuris suis]|uniref:Uncharacterized protein n=3 Tax=Trichuris suis TaxID=68888 RepID=A0A085LL69_9BILA|nr:hypothetical protein M513_13404 [Trichuris suis]